MPPYEAIVQPTKPNTVEPTAVTTLYPLKKEAASRLLAGFKDKISTIGKHYLKANEEALELYYYLEYSLNYVFTNPNAEKMARFEKDATAKIKEAIPLLQKDLGWGDYLLNLIKHIINAVTYGLSFGTHQGFFEVKIAAAVKTTNDLRDDLRAVIL